MTTPHSYYVTWPWYIPNSISIHMISTLYIPLYSRYSPIISLSYLFYIPITLPVIFSVLLVVFPNLPFLGGPGLGSPFFKGGRLASSRAVAFSRSRDRWSPGRHCPGMEHGFFSDKTQQFPSVVVVFGGSSPRKKGLESRTPRVFGVSGKYMLETLRFGC